MNPKNPHVLRAFLARQSCYDHSAAGSLASQRADGGTQLELNHWEAEGPLLCLFEAIDDNAACLKHCQSLGGSRVGGHLEWQYFIFANYYLYYHNSFSEQFLQPSPLDICYL